MSPCGHPPTAAAALLASALIVTAGLPFPAAAASASAAARSAARAAAAADLTGDKAVDIADVTAFLQAVKDRKALDPALDLDGDKDVDLEDALLFGRWVNGLWEKPASGFAPLQFRDPADEAVFRAYPGQLKAAQRSTSLASLRQAHPEAAGAPPAYAPASLEFSDRVGAALAAWKPGFAATDFLARVAKDGMAVSQSVAFPNYFQALDRIHQADLPLIVTTDLLLHTVHLSYDNILLELETERILPALDRILVAAREYSLAHHGTSEAAADVREVLEVALLLLDPRRPDIAPTDALTKRLEEIQSLRLTETALFGRDTLFDFSQFKPRGHYTRTPQLSRYFQAMMWLSRVDLAFDLRPLGDPEHSPAVTRMKKGALLLWDAVVASGSYPAWLEINGLLEYLVGQSDGLTAKGMGTVAHSLGIRSVPDFVKAFPEARFDSALAASGLGMQAILSQAKMYAPGQGDLNLSPIFSFMPQRFILDSYTFSQVVHPVTGMRAMPSSLDIAFVLGDNSALADMDPVLTGNAPGALAAQRGLYGALGPGAWRSNLYMSWLDFLRQLNPKDNSAFAPAFRTAAWNRKMRNTQLASWAQLRRNTILYAKQSYTGGVICEFPKAYVEPYPEFFAAVEAYAALGRKVLKDQPKMADYFASLEATARRLAEAAARTAQGLPPTEEQMAWLKTALSSRLMPAGCGSARIYDGWYRSLIYGPLPTEAERSKDFTIADVHTKPYSDELGPSQVLHVASGPVQMMAVAVKLDTCVSLFVGPVSSYYDVPRIGLPLTRMNDEEWTREVDTLGTLAKRPPWVASFLAP